MMHEKQARITQWWYRQFPPQVLTFIPVAVAINLGIGTLAQIAKLPVFLDSIGTVAVGVLCGPVAAIVAGVITVLVGGVLTNPVLPWFAFTAVVIGGYTGFIANRGAFLRPWIWVLSGLVLGILTAIVSAPVIVALFGGITPSGSSVVVAYFIATGKQVLSSVILAGFACDPIDKCLTFVIVFLMVRSLPLRIRAQFPRGVPNTVRESPKA